MPTKKYLAPPIEGQVLPNGSSAHVKSPQASAMGLEPIRARVMELVEILVESMAQDPEAKAITAMAPILLMVLQNYELGKLRKLMSSLEGISRAVLDLACSQDEYNDRMEPLIRQLAESLS